jgi:hypothetical protein
MRGWLSLLGNRLLTGKRGCTVLSAQYRLPSSQLYAWRTSSARYKLNGYFCWQQAIGDVAFDGTNLYVSGLAHSQFRCANRWAGARWATFSTAQTLSPAISGALHLGDWTGAADHRMAARVIPGWLIQQPPLLGCGIGCDATNTGIRRVDTSGTIDGSWSGDGVLLPVEISPSATRFDTLDVDPYGPALGIGVFGSSNIRRNRPWNRRSPLQQHGAIGICPQTVATRAISPSHRMAISMCATTRPAAQALQGSTLRHATMMAASEVQPQS